MQILSENRFIQYINQNHRVLVVLFFIAYLLLGCIIFRDYGISWDEELNRTLGAVNLQYIEQRLGTNVFKVAPQAENLESFRNRDYGAVFETVLYTIERIAGLKDVRAIFLMRHFVTFMIFFIATVFFYFLITRLTGSWSMGLIGTIFLIASPRIFAHSFYNSKDIVLLSMFIISTSTLFRLLDRVTIGNVAIHALTTATTIGIRFAGLVLIPLTLIMLLLTLFNQRAKKIRWQTVLSSVLFYVILCAGLTLLFYPFLWSDPVNRFAQSIKSSAHYHMVSGDTLYLGKFIKITDLPWHYIPVWIVITTPYLYLILFIFSFVLFWVRTFIKPARIIKDKYHGSHMYFMLLFSMPILTVIFFQSTLYDGWRHLYFIYPALIASGIIGLDLLRKRSGIILKYVKIVTVILIFAGLFNVGKGMIKAHPYQNVYFNKFAGNDLIKDFELDYWGLSYRRGLEYIINNDDNPKIKIFVSDYPGQTNAYMLEMSSRKRLHYVGSPYAADYFLSNFRHELFLEKYLNREYPFEHEIYAVKAGGLKILGVYKLTPQL